MVPRPNENARRADRCLIRKMFDYRQLCYWNTRLSGTFRLYLTSPNSDVQCYFSRHVLYEAMIYLLRLGENPYCSTSEIRYYN